jgi:hypothetical protein
VQNAAFFALRMQNGDSYALPLLGPGRSLLAVIVPTWRICRLLARPAFLPNFAVRCIPSVCVSTEMTTTEQIEEQFKALTEREDIAILLINQYVREVADRRFIFLSRCRCEAGARVGSDFDVFLPLMILLLLQFPIHL